MLRTKRLTLRQIGPEETQRLFYLRANKMVSRFIAREVMKEEKEASEILSVVKTAYENKTGITWAGFLRDNKEMIGACAIRNIDHIHHSAELGGEMIPEYWGKNLALEAVQAVVSFGLQKLNLHRIEASVFPENRAAIFLMEAIGFKKEGHFKEKVFFRDNYSDLALYSILAGDLK